MKVWIVARNEIEILRLESRSDSGQDVSSDPPRVVLCREQIAAHLRRESVAAIERQSTQRHCRELSERRQWYPSDWLRRPDVRLEWIQTTFYQVHQCVPHTAGGMLIPVVRPDDL